MRKKTLSLAALALLAPLLLGACSKDPQSPPVRAPWHDALLEVDQYPAWIDGEYDDKFDHLPSQVHFHNDRLAWNAVITNRNHLQNEYNRTRP